MVVNSLGKDKNLAYFLMSWPISLSFYLIPLILHVEYMLVYYYCLNSIQALYLLTILFNSSDSPCRVYAGLLLLPGWGLGVHIS